MTSSDHGVVPGLEAAIQVYVAAHPGAVDSVIGIRRWWLPAEFAYYSIADIEAGLRTLVAAGKMREQRLPDGRVVYAGHSHS